MAAAAIQGETSRPARAWGAPIGLCARPAFEVLASPWAKSWTMRTSRPASTKAGEAAASVGAFLTLMLNGVLSGAINGPEAIELIETRSEDKG